MVGSLSGGEGLSSASSLYFSQLSRAGSAGSSVSSLTGGEGGGAVSQTSASISGPGQLLSNLQQLQTQDPTKFQQVVSDIASQLQAASQQSQGPQSDFLANLASKFQNVANGGSLSQLQPQGHHHHHHGQQAYSQSSQSQSQGVAGLAQSSSSQSSSGSSLQQLFASISSEVTQALAG
jgi:hypothetical protein